MSDYLFRGTLADLDPEVYELTQIEAERQVRKIILTTTISACMVLFCKFGFCAHPVHP